MLHICNVQKHSQIMTVWYWNSRAIGIDIAPMRFQSFYTRQIRTCDVVTRGHACPACVARVISSSLCEEGAHGELYACFGALFKSIILISLHLFINILRTKWHWNRIRTPFVSSIFRAHSDNDRPSKYRLICHWILWVLSNLAPTPLLLDCQSW